MRSRIHRSAAFIAIVVGTFVAGPLFAQGFRAGIHRTMAGGIHTSIPNPAVFGFNAFNGFHGFHNFNAFNNGINNFNGFNNFNRFNTFNQFGGFNNFNTNNLGNFNGINSNFANPFVHATPGFVNTAGGFVPAPRGTAVLSSPRGFVPSMGAFVPSPRGRFELAVRERYNPLLNAYVPARSGNVIAETRGNFVPTRDFGRATTGTVNPFTGTFVPTMIGSSTLTARGRFVPSLGTFLPNARGPFTLTTREAINPFTGFATPSPFGNFVARERGFFVPAGFGSGFVSPLANSFVRRQNPWMPFSNMYGNSTSNVSGSGAIGGGMGAFFPMANPIAGYYGNASASFGYTPYVSPFSDNSVPTPDSPIFDL